MGQRHKAREQALQVLYLIDLTSTPWEKALDLFRNHFNASQDLEYVRLIVSGVMEKGNELDQLIETHSDHWTVSRMPRIDRNILRIGTYELRHCPDIPSSVALDEAIELSKKYGEEKTSSFVNGILDRISKEIRT